MPIVHIVLFKLRPDVTSEQKDQCISMLKTLQSLPCVLDGHLLVGGPSITDPIAKSKGYDVALVSHHPHREALAEYQASAEHKRATQTYVFPITEDLIRFDFETADHN